MTYDSSSNNAIGLRERPPPFSLRRFLYNPQERTYLGKRPDGWGKTSPKKFLK